LCNNHNIDPECYNRQALRCAARKGHLKIYRLLESFALRPARFQDSVLIEAARYNQLKVIKYLVARGCTPGSDCLLSAARGGHPRILRYLIRGTQERRFHCRLDTRDYEAILLAIKGNSLRALRYLAHEGGRLMSQDCRELRAALRRSHIKILKYLLWHVPHHYRIKCVGDLTRLGFSVYDYHKRCQRSRLLIAWGY
jgi:hypothetical protein